MQFAVIFARALRGRQALLPRDSGQLWAEATSLLRGPMPGSAAGLATWARYLGGSAAPPLQQAWPPIRPITSLRGIVAPTLPQVASAVLQRGSVRHASGPARPTPPFVGGKLKPFS
jgi:hypothetical protein